MKRLFLKSIVTGAALVCMAAAIPAFAQDIKERTIKFAMTAQPGHPA